MRHSPMRRRRGVELRRQGTSERHMADRSSEGVMDPDGKTGPKPEAEPEVGAMAEAGSTPEPSPESDLPPETEASDAAENQDQPADEIDEEAQELRRSYLLRRFWHTAFRFWTTPGRRIAWLLSAALLAII